MADMPPDTESYLCRIRAGDSAALAELFNYYRPRLRQMVRLRQDPRIAARVDPSDVIQETYLDVARQINGYLRNPQVAFYVWLRGLAWERLLNLQRMHLGARCRAVGREVPLPAQSSVLLARQLLAKGSSPSQALLRDELRRRVQNALAALDPTDREVILMRHFENMSNSEVAHALGLTDAGATRRYGRAVFRLRERLVAGLGTGESRP